MTANVVECEAGSLRSDVHLSVKVTSVSLKGGIAVDRAGWLFQALRKVHSRF